MTKVALLIPVYEPEEGALDFLCQFKEGDFDDFVLVNDGSGPAFEAIFDRIRNETVFHVIDYPENHGKGYALRFGIEELLRRNEQLATIITADGDGQHAYKDILRVKETALANPNDIVLGNRAFDPKTVPLASKIGHALAKISFKTSSRQKIDDVQTGLRAIPESLFELALQTPGNRYDYESDFLLEAAKEVKIIPIDIEAIYIDHNRNSHFRPFIDTIVIYKKVILYILASLASWGIDLGLFYLFSTYVFTSNSEMQVYASTIVARIISGFFNFVMLFFVFDRARGFGRKFWKYMILFFVNLGLSSTLTYLFKFLPAALTFIKFVVDAIISIANYFVNKIWVFARKRRKSPKKIERKEARIDQ